MRKWQEEAYAAWHRSQRRGIVAAVTGGGKTNLALHCIDYYRKSVPGATILIVVPTTALLEQWLDEIVAFFDIPLSHISVLSSRSKPKASRINIGVINTVSQLVESNKCPTCFLVVDECHRAASESFRRIFGLPRDACLGLSATPERQYDDGLTSILIPALGPVIYTYTYKEALADGVIVPFVLHNILFEFDPDEKIKYEKLTKAIRIAAQKYGIESPEAVRLMLKRTRISNLSLARVRLACMLVAQNPRRRILLFHEDIAACDLINQILCDNGIAAAVYHSRITLANRVASLSKYRKGEVNVLVTCRALDEGFNVPETEIGIVAASTATYRQRIQRLGRVLRPTEGKSGATIYSIVASMPEIRRLAEEAESLEGIAEVKWTHA